MFETARELASAIRSRQISAAEALEVTLTRIDATNPELNAVIWRNDDEARAAAQAADALVARTPIDELPPFLGVPIPIKDVTEVEGWPVTYGSHGAPSGNSESSELVVKRFQDAGFILTGRTNTSEFGSLPAAENRRYGITRNPWMPCRTPGGSSGGAAAAVAAGLFTVAHANDIAGSIRVPASCCGLVGLKASRGRIPSTILPGEGAAVEGVVTHDVADTAAVLELICGPDLGQWYNAPKPTLSFTEALTEAPRPLRVGVVSNGPFGQQFDIECLDAVMNTARVLEGLGHEIVPTELALPGEALAAAMVIINAGLTSSQAIEWAKTERHTQATLRNVQAVNSAEYVAAAHSMQRFTREFVKSWSRAFDVLLTPTMAITPPKAGSVLDAADAADGALPVELVQMNILAAGFNLTGQPAISLPVHTTADGLPVGVQLVGSPWEEWTLLGVSAQLEQAIAWRSRVPAPLRGEGISKVAG